MLKKLEENFIKYYLFMFKKNKIKKKSLNLFEIVFIIWSIC